MTHDIIISGGGPAGSSCAAFCAAGGLKTLVLEKTAFPRDKVCGDCINPACWPVLERLGVAGRILDLPHSKLEAVEFIGINGRSIEYQLEASGLAEIAVKRSLFDHVLLQRAIESGAEVRQNAAVTSVERGWKVKTGDAVFSAPWLVAADGRNSTILRLLGIAPPAARERVALQTHIPVPDGFGNRVTLRFLREGYCGYANVGDGCLNLCLVGKPADISRLKQWAETHFKIGPGQSWRTITPLARKAVPAANGKLLLVGDAARVIEPFTGEGIYYAIATGELAANHVLRGLSGESYRREHSRLYSGRLWVNCISKQAVLHPKAATLALDAMRHHPASLRFLTSKVVGAALASPSAKKK